MQKRLKGQLFYKDVAAKRNQTHFKIRYEEESFCLPPGSTTGIAKRLITKYNKAFYELSKK